MTRRRTLVVAGLAAVTILSTILRLLVPLWVIGDAVEDDQLFVRLGSSLRDGAWLGPFDTRTLQKGPAFPAFLAVAQQTRLPYLLVVHLVHLLACAAAAGAIGRAAGSRPIGCWLYVVLALDPSYYGWGASRVLRDNWYSSVCLLLFALAALALPGSGSGGPAVASRWARRVLAGVAAGLVLAGYWLTRAEHPWLLPAIATVLAAAVVFRRHRLRPAGRWRGWLVAAGPVIGCAAVAVAVLAATTWGVAAQNRRAYGVSLTDDFAGGQFAAPVQHLAERPRGSRPPVRPDQPAAAPRRLPGERRGRPAAAGPGGTAAGIRRRQLPAPAGLRRHHRRADPVRDPQRDRQRGRGPHRGAGPALLGAGRRRDRGGVLRRAAVLRPADADDAAQPVPGQRGRLRGVGVVGFRWLATYGPADTDRPPSTGSAGNWALFHRTVNGLPATLRGTPEPERVGLARARYLAVLRLAYQAAVLVLLPVALAGYVLAPLRRPARWAAVWVLGWRSPDTCWHRCVGHRAGPRSGSSARRRASRCSAGCCCSR